MLKLILKIPILILWWIKIKRLQDGELVAQKKCFKALIRKAQTTQFGKEHNFSSIKNYEQFKERVPIRHYKDFKPYLDKVIEGEENILWPNPYKYMLMTAKSTGDDGDKFIPISAEGLKDLVKISLNMLLNFAVKTKNYDILLKRGLYLGASPRLGKKGKYPYGLLSGVSYYLKPKFLRNFGLPSFETNAIENWEEKIVAIENEIINNDLGVIVGTPPWVNKLLINLHNRVQVPLKKYFNGLTLFMFGGAPIDLYEKQVKSILGDEVHLLENYPASEGFIGYQDEFPHQGLLLQTNFGIFYEFITKKDYYNGEHNRIPLSEIKTDIEYAVVLNTNSGLFGYIIGDIVKFHSLSPYRFKITGRLRHYINYLKQTLNDGDLTTPLSKAIQKNNLPIGEYTFAPSKFGIDLYYETYGDVELNSPQIKLIRSYFDISMNFNHIKENSIYQYMKETYKLGGQFKITRIRNDRRIVEFLDQFKI